MREALRRYRDHIILTCVLPSAEQVTSFTKSIRFTANSVSRAMDTANGGVLKHGGFHRIFGGHSIADLKLWSKHGLKFPYEIGKDAFTTNGVPIPGVETAASNGWIKAGFAQKWGCLNVGDIGAGVVGILDTALNFRKLVREPEAFSARANRVFLKGTLKIAVGTSHGNLPLAAVGVCDIGLAGYSKYQATASRIRVLEGDADGLFFYGFCPST